ncbi:RluA family pseudouridine synthase [Gemmatimonas sp.]|uniref:RluA family pseudouridine synthase n=1 Tax=Gemmatimonas sp. TaxID=1962908 RepID=UPI00286DC409|nr:RluA family pseudouridine synthase [Gemmatimonas sp.]
MIRFTSPPDASDLPARFPSPFDRAAVHPLARRAAMETMDLLQLPAMAPWRLDQPGNGKMFGVLVVAASDGTVGYLRGFSGMVAGMWTIEGWAPPTYDEAARDAVWIPGEAELYDLGTDDDARTARSRELLPAIQETYRFTNAWGEVRALRDLFAPKEPPGGAGDCAAPKLLAQAYAQGLRPLALAEFWWGAPPRTGDRRAGSFYPACQGKCPPILAHMLRGVPADPPPLFGAAAIAEREPAVVYEDEHLVVVNKPCGLLSVPGRSGLLRDSVSTRLRARYPDATGQLVVHRLDLDTSGLLLAAKDTTTFSALQRLFSLREIAKRYVAWLDGHVQDDEGVIDFPMRMDIDDRPRQIHDPVHGKAAVTTWQVLTRADGRTKVAFTPHTGRTHQLRVHASNPIGLDAPIVGDRLYGRVAPEYGERLLLHAESLAFTHPVTGVEVRVTSSVPF